MNRMPFGAFEARLGTERHILPIGKHAIETVQNSARKVAGNGHRHIEMVIVGWAS
jgi:hypothetical protein